jgi:hypothetical protein
MPKLIKTLTAVTVLALALALPAVASATARTEHSSPDITYDFKLHGSKGFTGPKFYARLCEGASCAN